jgi:hypothetical protein
LDLGVPGWDNTQEAVVDTDSYLQWLTWTTLDSASPLAGDYIALDGYRYATADEVRDFLVHGGIAEYTAPTDVGYEEWQQFMGFLDIMNIDD